MRRIVWSSLAVAVVVLLAALFHLDEGRLPNVVLVTVDTLRADHVIDTAGKSRGG